MPGVPSGRGCEACRKQKKKCDQGQPACSRCARLRIPCIGSGQQRYKFKAQTGHPKPARHAVRVVSRSPTNQITKVAHAFVSVMEVTDIRYCPRYYGAFLQDAARHLGENEALDASVEALTTAFPFIYTRQKTPEMYLKYCGALKALRLSLEDPVKARSSCTLCAIYIVIMCQSWIGSKNDPSPRHGEIMSQILSAVSLDDWRGGFKGEMLRTMCVPVIFEAFSNPRINLDTPWFQSILQSCALPKPSAPIKGESTAIQSLDLPSLARFPTWIRDPQMHFFDINSAYQQANIELKVLRRLVVQYADVEYPQSFYPATAQCQMALALLLKLAAILNGLLRAFDPHDVELAKDSVKYSKECVALAIEMSPLRPIPAAMIPLCLVSAWAVTDDPSQRAEVERILADYETDFAEARAMESAYWLKNRFEKLRLQMSTYQPDYLAA